MGAIYLCGSIFGNDALGDLVWTLPSSVILQPETPVSAQFDRRGLVVFSHNVPHFVLLKRTVLLMLTRVRGTVGIFDCNFAIIFRIIKKWIFKSLVSKYMVFAT